VKATSWVAGIAIALATLAAGGALAQTPAASPPPAVFDGMLPSGRRTESLVALAEREPRDEEEQFKLLEIGRDERSSHHVAWIRDQEAPHRHDHHDLLMVVVRGHGTMLLGQEERPVGEGSVVFIPRGTGHAFRNKSAAPALVYGQITPPYDAADRVLLGVVEQTTITAP
jgi:mannose-6-phosphate isomerase-like protein (cupin superfamily)